MVNLLTISVILSFLGVANCLQFPRNPDQMRWATKTCFREFRDAPPSLLRKWNEWDLPSSNLTYCFVKCNWIYAGIYNEKTNEFNVDAIRTQFTSQGFLPPKGLENLQRRPAKTSCKDIYRMSIGIIKKYKSEFIKAFYGYSGASTKWYNDNRETVKGKYQRASEFCKSKEKECQLHCRFYYYRLVDEDYQIFNRKFKIYGISDVQLQQCREKASQAKGCRVAKTLKQCLEKIDSEKVKLALKSLDEISANY